MADRVCVRLDLGDVVALTEDLHQRLGEKSPSQGMLEHWVRSWIKEHRGIEFEDKYNPCSDCWHHRWGQRPACDKGVQPSPNGVCSEFKQDIPF